ncbi:MerR family DNA-binding protein [Moraxella nasovis]|uniref:MerR family DNA-binding protein n=1 Tax=Moraxella nasovis TaxID=2904121 RepID=UPI001F620553|nr:MerR family DNA-binding protein [Moraxella nasovis]UNU73837.1 MerR family DNA-binding protein [Moraxella nasovis]
MKNLLQVKTVSEQVGLSLESIRYYEKMGLISPIRGENGYRLFNQEMTDTLKFIKNCRHVGFSVEEIKALQQMQSQPHNRCDNATELLTRHIARIDEQIAQLQHMKAHLTALQGCQENDVAHCKVITGLQKNCEV